MWLEKRLAEPQGEAAMQGLSPERACDGFTREATVVESGCYVCGGFRQGADRGEGVHVFGGEWGYLGGPEDGRWVLGTGTSA